MKRSNMNTFVDERHQRLRQMIEEAKANEDYELVKMLEEIYLNEINPPQPQKTLIETLYSKEITSSQNYGNLHPSLMKALLYLEENYTTELSLADLSRAAYASPSHLSYLFKQHLGKTYKQILVELRIHHGQKMIEKEPNTKITDIILSSGFGDLSHFEKMFKRYVGCTPRIYKKRFQ